MGAAVFRLNSSKLGSKLSKTVFTLSMPDCPEEDMQTVELSKVVIPIEFTEEFCSHGLDFAIVELKRRIEVCGIYGL